jgi:general secretion pathway protein I
MRGFTLLEVLVALAVLSISLGALLPVFSSTLRNEDALSDQTTAILLAQSKLDALGTEIPIVDGKSQGRFDNGFTWRLEIGPYPFDRTSALVTPKMATLTVAWPARTGVRSLSISTIRLVGHE